MIFLKYSFGGFDFYIMPFLLKIINYLNITISKFNILDHSYDMSKNVRDIHILNIFLMFDMCHNKWSFYMYKKSKIY